MAERLMKNSGVEWIGAIPSEWNVCRVKNVASLYTGNSIKDELKSNYEDPINAHPYISSKDIDANLQRIDYNNGMYVKDDDESFEIAKEGDTLMCIEGGSAGRKKAILNQKVSFVNKLCCFSPNNIEAKYLYYYLMSPGFEKEFNKYISGLIGGVSVSILKNFWIQQPSKDEQTRIVDFLDKKVSEIDTVISKTNESIEEYKKLKQSIITEAVTKGLDSNVEMKESSNMDIPIVPKAWSMEKLKRLFSIKKDIAGKEGYTVLSITQKGIIPKNIDSNEGQLAADYSNYQLVNVGDFAMNHMDLLTGWIDISKYYGVTSPDYRVFTLINRECTPKYYLYFFQMCYTNKYFYHLGQGVSGMGRWRLQAPQFLNFEVPIPPFKEQEEIAEFLDIQCSKFDALISKKEQFIAELEQYKKSLIYEYVTGKKEVA